MRKVKVFFLQMYKSLEYFLFEVSFLRACYSLDNNLVKALKSRIRLAFGDVLFFNITLISDNPEV